MTGAPMLGMAVNYYLGKPDDFAAELDLLVAAGLDAVEPNCPSPEDLALALPLCDAAGLRVSAVATGRVDRGSGSGNAWSGWPAWPALAGRR